MNNPGESNRQMTLRTSNGFDTKLLTMDQWRPQPQGSGMELTREAWHTKNQLSKAQSDLEEVLSARSKTPASETGALMAKDSLIEEMQQKIATLEARLHHQEQEIHNQKIRIQQQADTITNQSQEIAKTSRPSHWNMPPTEFRLPSQYQGRDVPGRNIGTPIDYQAPTPVLSPPHNPGAVTRYGLLNDVGYLGTNSAAFRPPTAFGDPFASRNLKSTASPLPPTPPHGFVSENGSPLPIERGGNLRLNNTSGSSEINNTLSTPQRPFSRTVSSNHITPNSSHSSGRQPTPQGLLAPAPLKAGTPLLTKQRSDLPSPTALPSSELIAKAYQSLFDNTLKFTFHYCNTPSTSFDGKLPQHIKNVLMSGGGTTVASRIMASQNSRYFLVAKIILQWMSKHIIQPNAFDSFNTSTDHNVEEQRKRIWGSTPDNVRYDILNNIASQFQSLKTQTNWNKFLDFKITQRSEELYANIVHLMYQGSEGAQEEMHDLVSQAHRLSYMQLCNTVEWRISYPTVNEPFDPNTMVNMDSDFKDMAIQTIVSKNGNVRLGALPQVSSRSLDCFGRTSSQVNIRAGVLLKFP